MEREREDKKGETEESKKWVKGIENEKKIVELKDEEMR